MDDPADDPNAPQLLWSDKWMGKYESAISLVWKLVWANNLTYQEFRSKFACRKYGGLANVDGDTLPFVGQRRYWEELAPYGRERAQKFRAPGTVRFCRDCLRLGYISVFHQFAILDRCPLHGQPLENRCRCGASTGPYRVLSHLSLKHPFHCHVCGEALAGEFLPQLFFEAGTGIHTHEHLLDPLHDWAKRIAARELWIADYLFADPLLSVPRVEREADMPRRHYCAKEISEVLYALEPLGVPKEHLSVGKRPLVSVLLEYRVEDPIEFHYDWREEDAPGELVEIIDRHIRRRYLRGLSRHRKLYQMAADRSWCATMFVPPSGVHPLVHAYWLWRLYMVQDRCYFMPSVKRDDVFFGKHVDTNYHLGWGKLTPKSQLHYFLGTYFELTRTVLEAIDLKVIPSAWSIRHLDAAERKLLTNVPASRSFVFRYAVGPFCSGIGLAENHRSVGGGLYYCHVPRAVANAARRGALLRT